MRLSIAIDNFIADVCAGKANETPKAYRAKLSRLVDNLGDVDVRAVLPDDLERFKQRMLARTTKWRGAAQVEGKLSIWTIRSVLRTVRHFFRWLSDRGHARRNPALGLKLPKEPKKNPKGVSDEAFQRLLDAARTTGPTWERARNVAMLMLMRGTGGRIGEVISATMEGLNLESGVLFTTGKGGQVRALLLNEPEMGALHQWLELRKTIETRSDHVFIGGSGRHRGHPLTRSAVYKIMDKLRVVAGLPKGTRLNPHSFRHGFALKSLDNGARIDEVSQMMGHSSVAVTIDYYGQRDVEYLRRAHRNSSPTRNVKPGDWKLH